jgi:hypothetical protein
MTLPGLPATVIVVAKPEMLADVKQRATCRFVTGWWAATAKAAAPLPSRAIAITAATTTGCRRLGVFAVRLTSSSSWRRAAFRLRAGSTGIRSGWK